LPDRHVLVLNHFAVPMNAPGGTRHAELATRLTRWRATIVAGNRNLLTRGRTQFDATFRPVWVWPYAANGPARILNWLSYGVTSLVAGLRLGRVDAVYASSPHLLAGLSGWALARLRRVPFVLEIRDLWPDVLVDMGTLAESSPLFRLLRALERFLYRKAARVVVLADGSVPRLCELGVERARIDLIPNGADPDDFRSPGDRDGLRARFGFDGFVVVYAGAHGPANGLDLVLDAAATLRSVEPDVSFALVGDGVEKARLQERAAREGLDNVYFLDPVPKSDIPALFHAADAGLHALADVPLFRYGVSPNKLYDYLAAGLPTVTNTPGEVGGIVREAEAGVAVGPTGIAEGVAQVRRASDEQRRTWGENGRRWMAAHRSRRALAARLEAVLDSVVPG
jgi:glycosyltransferase involved in cell wall biosynthesis